MLWNDTYEIYKHLLKNIEKSFVVFTGELKYDERWARANQFTLQEEYSTFEVLN
jgi:hypothetical protein